MMNKPIYILLFIIVLSSISSCKLFYPNTMFKTERKASTSTSPADTVKKAYVINSGALLEINVFSNKGYKLIDVGAETASQDLFKQQYIQYLVMNNGYVRLPMIDSIYIRGYTVQEAEKMLEKVYATYFIEPFVVLRVVNRRIFVFLGGDEAKVVSLNNENVTLIEVLAEAGGIPSTAKAYKIKIIRGDPKNPIIRYIDLSTIDGMKNSNINIQASDIVYVDPVMKATTGLLKEISPFATIVSVILGFVVLFSK